MKLRQHKRDHIKRLRWLIKRRRVEELRAQFETGMDHVSTALVDALLAQGTLMRAAFASITAEFARTVLRSLPNELRIEAGANGSPVAHVDGSKISAAALIVMADKLGLGASRPRQVLMTAEQIERHRRALDKVQRSDPRQFTFSPKLPRR